MFEANNRSLCVLCSLTDFTCKANSFQCDNGQCIHKELVCDGDSACVDDSDEKNCNCLTTQFICPTGECLDENDLCDSKQGCKDKSDESRCGRQRLLLKCIVFVECVFKVYKFWRASCPIYYQFLLGLCNKLYDHDFVCTNVLRHTLAVNVFYELTKETAERLFFQTKHSKHGKRSKHI